MKRGGDDDRAVASDDRKREGDGETVKHAVPVPVITVPVIDENISATMRDLAKKVADTPFRDGHRRRLARLTRYVDLFLNNRDMLFRTITHGGDDDDDDDDNDDADLSSEDAALLKSICRLKRTTALGYATVIKRFRQFSKEVGISPPLMFPWVNADGDILHPVSIILWRFLEREIAVVGGKVGCTKKNIRALQWILTAQVKFIQKFKRHTHEGLVRDIPHIDLLVRNQIDEENDAEGTKGVDRHLKDVEVSIPTYLRMMERLMEDTAVSKRGLNDAFVRARFRLILSAEFTILLRSNAFRQLTYGEIYIRHIPRFRDQDDHDGVPCLIFGSRKWKSKKMFRTGCVGHRNPILDVLGHLGSLFLIENYGNFTANPIDLADWVDVMFRKIAPLSVSQERSANKAITGFVGIVGHRKVTHIGRSTGINWLEIDGVERSARISISGHTPAFNDSEKKFYNTTPHSTALLSMAGGKPEELGHFHIAHHVQTDLSRRRALVDIATNGDMSRWDTEIKAIRKLATTKKKVNGSRIDQLEATFEAIENCVWSCIRNGAARPRSKEQRIIPDSKQLFEKYKSNSVYENCVFRSQQFKKLVVVVRAAEVSEMSFAKTFSSPTKKAVNEIIKHHVDSLRVQLEKGFNKLIGVSPSAPCSRDPRDTESSVSASPRVEGYGERLRVLARALPKDTYVIGKEWFEGPLSLDSVITKGKEAYGGRLYFRKTFGGEPRVMRKRKEKRQSIARAIRRRMTGAVDEESVRAACAKLDEDIAVWKSGELERHGIEKFEKRGVVGWRESFVSAENKRHL